MKKVENTNIYYNNAELAKMMKISQNDIINWSKEYEEKDEVAETQETTTIQDDIVIDNDDDVSLDDLERIDDDEPTTNQTQNLQGQIRRFNYE